MKVGEHVRISTRENPKYNGRTGTIIRYRDSYRDRYYGWYDVEFDEPVYTAHYACKEDVFAPSELTVL